MRLVLLLILIPSVSWAQAALPLARAAKNNVVVIYDVNGSAIMVVVDANNLKDPAWNPAGSTQVAVPVDVYNAMAAPDFQFFISAHAPVTALNAAISR